MTPYVDAFKTMIFQSSSKHGLNPADYWTAELESYLINLDSTNAYVVELLLSENLIRFASHLSDGRIDPMALDNDVRFKKEHLVDLSS